MVHGNCSITQDCLIGSSNSSEIDSNGDTTTEHDQPYADYYEDYGNYEGDYYVYNEAGGVFEPSSAQSLETDDSALYC
jgi:hypothetical protein